MRRYAMQGTPTLILIDRAGRLRRQTFGHIPDLQLGAEIMALMREGPMPTEGATDPTPDGCTDSGCLIA